MKLFPVLNSKPGQGVVVEGAQVKYSLSSRGFFLIVTCLTLSEIGMICTTESIMYIQSFHESFHHVWKTQFFRASLKFLLFN